MRKWLFRLLILGGVAALAGRYALQAAEPVPVRVTEVGRARVEATITNSKAGTVRARRRAQLSAEVGGRVVEITHREGDRVEEGALLVRLNDASPRAQLTLANESLRVAQAGRREACVARDRAQRELERKRTLANQAIVSADLLDELESVAEATQAACNARAADVERARASIRSAEADLKKFAIHAPFSGVIAEQGVEVGEWVTPSPPLLSSPAVLDILDPESLYVSAPMDEVDSGSLREGQPAKVTVDSHPGQVFGARVVRVAPYVLDLEAQNRTVEIEVVLEDEAVSRTLLPGTSADVEVVLEARDDVLRLPTSALFDGDKVLLADDGRLVERTVEVGLKNWEYAEVTGGLTGGERVVTSLDRVEVKAGARFVVEDAADE